MNYRNLYDTIINNALSKNRAKGNELVLERHHIIPKSCGGSNKNDNLVNLTPKEHYICHLLLERIHRGSEFHTKMLRAAFMMGRNSRKTSRSYQAIKKEHIKNLRNQVISSEQKQAISIANKGNKSRTGMKNSAEHIEILRQSRLGKKVSDETKKIWREQRKGRIPWNKGLTGGKNPVYPKNRKSKPEVTEETREKMRRARIKWHENKKERKNG